MAGGTHSREKSKHQVSEAEMSGIFQEIKGSQHG